MDDLTVIVPMYNAQAFLPTALATLDQADLEGVRFLMIDDCSTDETGQLLDEAARSRPAIEVLHNEVNLGVAASRNRAHERVATRYVGYYDVDDWFIPGHFAALRAAIREYDVDFVRVDHVRATEYSRKIERVPGTRRDLAVPAHEGIGEPGERSGVDYPFLWAGIYDTTRLDASLFPFDESLRTAADRPWFWRLYMNASTMAIADPLTYFYRKSRNSTALTQAGNAATLHFVDAYERVRDTVVPTGNTAWIEKAAYAACRISLFHILKRGRLSPELQEELFRLTSALLASYPAEATRAVLRTYSRSDQIIIRRLLGAAA